MSQARAIIGDARAVRVGQVKWLSAGQLIRIMFLFAGPVVTVQLTVDHVPEPRETKDGWAPQILK